MGTDTAMPADKPRFVMLFEAGPDPLARRNGTEREPEYRAKLLLKRMLRDLGLTCISIGPMSEIENPSPT